MGGAELSPQWPGSRLLCSQDVLGLPKIGVEDKGAQLFPSSSGIPNPVTLELWLRAVAVDELQSGHSPFGTHSNAS